MINKPSAMNIGIFKSLQVRIIFILLFLLIPVIFLLSYNFARAENILKEKTSRLITSNLEQKGNKIENLLEEIKKISSITLTDETIINALQDYKSPDNFYNNKIKDFDTLSFNEIKEINEVESRLNYIKSNFFNYSTHVIIFGIDGLVYSSLHNIIDQYEFKRKYADLYKNQEWYEKLVKNKGRGMWIAPFSYGMDDQEETKYVSFVSGIRSSYNQDTLGVIMINFSEENFKEHLVSDMNGIISLINENNDIIFSSDSHSSYIKDLNNDLSTKNFMETKGYYLLDIDKTPYMVNYYQIKNLGWKVILTVPYSEVMHEIDSLKANTFTISIMVFGIFMLICVGLILHVTNPLKKLIQDIRKLRIGEYSVGYKKDENIDEVSDIINNFNFMFDRIKELVNVVFEKQQKEYDLRYQILMAQINPHFLFNTLNSIKWSATISGAGHVAKMIATLGKLLEVSINKGEDEISFKEELELTQSYIFIQNVRFSDKFKTSINVEEKALDIKVPKLILQPIVENTIIHGFKNKEGDGLIQIKTYLKEDVFRIEIKDNGEGMHREKIEEFKNNYVRQNDEKGHKGIGLRNVDDRLKLKYGKEFGLELYSEINTGTSIFVKIPIKKN